MMRTRYYPWQVSPDQWGIIDWTAMEFCRLPIKDTDRMAGFRMALLTWPTRQAADAWLQSCYITWAKWEKDGTERADQAVPIGWQPRPERFSPYANGLQFPTLPGAGR